MSENIMPDKSWKQFERRVARFFGSERTALSGGNSKVTRSDSLHPSLFIEAKQRQRFAAVRLWDATKRLADREAKTPVVCLSEKGRPGFWILIHADDMAALSASIDEVADRLNFVPKHQTPAPFQSTPQSTQT